LTYKISVEKYEGERPFGGVDRGIEMGLKEGQVSRDREQGLVTGCCK
jgi:hypothetical protein